MEVNAAVVPVLQRHLGTPSAAARVDHLRRRPGGQGSQEPTGVFETVGRKPQHPHWSGGLGSVEDPLMQAVKARRSAITVEL